jgi:hypothetical protein
VINEDQMEGRNDIMRRDQIIAQALLGMQQEAGLNLDNVTGIIELNFGANSNPIESFDVEAILREAQNERAARNEEQEA